MSNTTELDRALAELNKNSKNFREFLTVTGHLSQALLKVCMNLLVFSWIRFRQ